MNTNLMYDALTAELIEAEYKLAYIEKSATLAGARDNYIASLNEKFADETTPAMLETTIMMAVYSSIDKTQAAADVVQAFISELNMFNVTSIVVQSIGHILECFGDMIAWSVPGKSRVDEVLAELENVPEYLKIVRFAALRSMLAHMLNSPNITSCVSSLRTVSDQLKQYSSTDINSFQLMPYPDYISLYYQRG